MLLIGILIFKHYIHCSTHNMANFLENKGKVYYRFDIALWARSCADDKALWKFVSSVYAFIEKALSEGQSVLVHCLAGAHRAGTTGVLCLMHFGNLPHPQAIKVAKMMRPIIDPIGSFPDLLKRVDTIKAGGSAK